MKFVVGHVWVARDALAISSIPTRICTDALTTFTLYVYTPVHTCGWHDALRQVLVDACRTALENCSERVYKEHPAG